MSPYAHRMCERRCAYSCSYAYACVVSDRSPFLLFTVCTAVGYAFLFKISISTCHLFCSFCDKSQTLIAMTRLNVETGNRRKL